MTQRSRKRALPDLLSTLLTVLLCACAPETDQGAGEAIGRIEALKGYTRQGASLTREEAEKGALIPGMLAVLIVLSGDPLSVPDEDLLNIRVLETWLGGTKVYTREK